MPRLRGYNNTLEHNENISRGLTGLVRHKQRKTIEDILTNHTIDKNGCWIYQGKPSRAGYATVTFTRLEGKNTPYVHRLSYEYWYGPIPEGMVVHHICHRRMCINPEHLQLLSHSKNSGRHKRIQVILGECKHGEQIFVWCARCRVHHGQLLKQGKVVVKVVRA